MGGRTTRRDDGKIDIRVQSMGIDFENIDYLKNGTEKQRLAYAALTNNGIMTALRLFDPILVGTIPINIDIENSDLDIVCSFKERGEFIAVLKNRFGNADGFRVSEHKNEAVVANFRMDDFDIEIFGQTIPTRRQYAYRHMIVEHKLLCERGDAFRQKIIDLKRQGHKTEPAFAIALGLKGNPYIELLKYERRDS